MMNQQKNKSTRYQDRTKRIGRKDRTQKDRTKKFNKTKQIPNKEMKMIANHATVNTTKNTNTKESNKQCIL